MKSRTLAWISLTAAATGLVACGGMPSWRSGGSAASSASNMSFFVTSAGLGKGANLGGLEGADRHCQTLAAAVGAGHRSWKAYLGATASGAMPTVHPRDRIGAGPWTNAKGVVIAKSVDDLHANNTITKQTALTERGEVINGRGDTPNQHDVLTGAMPDGKVSDATCGNWTLDGAGAATVGHHDRMGLNEEAPAKSWNSSHPSRGCGQEALKSSGGAGLFYCFAAQ